MKLDHQGFYKPTLDESKCKFCDLCVKVCPALEKPKNPYKDNRPVSNAEEKGELIGFYNNVYVGYSEDDELRKNCSSGGLVTSLLIELLEKDLVDYIVAVDSDSKDPLKFTPVILESKEDILACSGSKYTPVPQSTSISQILKKEGKYAVVGLPCHIQGFCKATENINELEERIKFKISLFCGGTTSLNATKRLLNSLDIKEENVSEIDFRGEGWPGYFKIENKDGTEIMVPYGDIKAMGGVFSSALYRPLFCSLCDDPFGRFSDVSLGDAWHKKAEDDLGQNIMITRKENIDDILDEMENKRIIDLKKKSSKDVLSSNPSLVKSKYENINRKAKHFKSIYKPKIEPEISFEEDQLSAINSFQILLFLIFKKYLDSLNQDKLKSGFPISGFRILKLVNLLERGM